MCVSIIFNVAYYVLAMGSFCGPYYVQFIMEMELSLSVVPIDPLVFKELQ
jgi:hypothetical protein